MSTARGLGSELANARVVVGTAAVLVLVVLLPTAFVFVSADSYSLPFATAQYVLVFRLNPMGLLFGLLAALPYLPAFQAQVSHRYLFYTRTRSSLRTTLRVRFLACSAATFTTFFVVGLLPFVLITLSGSEYSPATYNLSSPAQVVQAESTYATFTELTRVSPWLFCVFFSVWLGVNAALYATIAVSCTLLTGNRLVGFSLPWVTGFVVSFACAVLGLESYSPGTILPFNLEQIPFWKPMVPFAVTLLVAVVCVWQVFARSDSLKDLS